MGLEGGSGQHWGFGHKQGHEYRVGKNVGFWDFVLYVILVQYKSRKCRKLNSVVGQTCWNSVQKKNCVNDLRKLQKKDWCTKSCNLIIPNYHIQLPAI